MNADAAIRSETMSRRVAEDARRREVARAAAARHSRRVRRLKWVLPAAGAVIVLGIAGTMVISSLTPGFDVGSLSLSSDGIVMDNPHISGHDGNNRSYEVTADRAVQSITDPKKVKLENINATIKLGDGTWAAFKAGTGRFDGNQEQLTLEGGIAVESNDGYRATLKAADVDLRGGVVASDSPIEFTSDQATIRAGTLSVAEGGRAIRFKGGVTMTINPGAFQRKAAASDAGNGKEAEAALPVSPKEKP